jgi:oligopeptide/dipeptide ABC transporter ATP-binding protein
LDRDPPTGAQGPPERRDGQGRGLSASGSLALTTPLLSVEGLVREFAVRADGWGGGRSARALRAVDDVTFQVGPGETLGLVGESGCGKTTVGRLILRLLPVTAGRIVFDGRDVTHVPERRLRDFRRSVQVVFQDPYSSLNPRLTVRDIVGEPLRNFGATRRAATARVGELLDTVGLAPAYMSRYPHAFSGGQRQRIGIARALALGPRLLVCDEAVSSLDVSVQAQVLNLLADLQRQLGLALLFISHNLAVVRHVSHRVAVMYLGRLVEVAPEAALFEHPRHPYTRALLAAVPEARLDAAPPAVLPGEMPSPLDPPAGCRFQTRCPRAEARCREAEPPLAADRPGHWVRCYFPEPEPLRRTA